jgi:hypothetical protein
MTQNDPTLEWGLPNWRDANSYTNCFGRPDQWSEKRWRWEFKRRQPEYRNAFNTYAQQRRDGSIVRDHVEKINENGHRVMVTPGATEKASFECSNELGFMFVADAEELERFQMYFLPNPRFSHQPNKSLLFGNRIETARRDQEGLLVGEATYRFDLMEPLAPQLEECMRVLKFHQGLLPQAKAQRRWHKDFFPDYLQALDARECGASYDEITVYIPLKKKNRQAARALVKQARQVQYNF